MAALDSFSSPEGYFSGLEGKHMHANCTDTNWLSPRSTLFMQQYVYY